MGIFERSQDEPGAASQPEGDGPVTLADRTEPGGQGSPDTNQGKTEPMSPVPDHPEPAADLPTLAEMSVGAGDPQAPAHPDAAPGQPKVAPAAAEGPAAPQGAGASSRVPGSLGATPEGEAVGTDTAAGAARMTSPGEPLTGGHGETGPSPSTGDAPLEGSSEEQPVVTGTRTPDAR